MKPTVILLNGTSSAGKTSIAKAIQELDTTPFLLIGIDTLYNMLPNKNVGSTEAARKGYFFAMKDGLLEHIEIGPYAHKLLECTIPLVHLLLEHGNDLVIDEILFAGEGRDFLFDYARIFEDFCAYFVKVECPLEELERREALRSDRHRGVARWQYNHIHNHGFAYDITVNTLHFSSEECAQQILGAMKSLPNPQAFAAIRARKKEA